MSHLRKYDGADLSEVSELTIKLENFINHILKINNSDFDNFIFVFEMYPKEDKFYKEINENLTVSKK